MTEFDLLAGIAERCFSHGSNFINALKELKINNIDIRQRIAINHGTAQKNKLNFTVAAWFAYQGKRNLTLWLCRQGANINDAIAGAAQGKHQDLSQGLLKRKAADEKNSDSSHLKLPEKIEVSIIPHKNVNTISRNPPPPLLNMDDSPYLEDLARYDSSTTNKRKSSPNDQAEKGKKNGTATTPNKKSKQDGTHSALMLLVNVAETAAKQNQNEMKP